MTAKEHYDRHLGNFYSWMAGDFDEKQKEHQQFLIEHQIKPFSTQFAIDLGAGHGIQSVSLAKLGFKVKAIDFNKQLLTELKLNSKGFDIDVIEDDIRLFNKHIDTTPELIICWGDTITHLNSETETEQLLIDCCEALTENGKLIISFRDYSNELIGDNRFIPVKSDENKILTCLLEYFPEHVRVTDLFYEKEESGWKQKVSSYNKIRISVSSIRNILLKNGMKIIFDDLVNRLNTIIATKG
ncbi:MAG: methyltransferase protein [Mucilaginibacter sp.]|nr:methyltransferase protein [Mucilaginibacter sp.]